MAQLRHSSDSEREEEFEQLVQDYIHDTTSIIRIVRVGLLF